MSNRLAVLKFGGSLLRLPQDLEDAVSEIYRHVREGYRVVAVASAFEGVTDALLAGAEAWGVAKNAHAAAELVATGEVQSCAQLALALTRAGIRAKFASPHAVDLRCTGDPLDAEPRSLAIVRVLQLLRGRDVLVIPGFLGVDPEEGISLLGRGGSDYSALFLADRLNADRCVLFKDVHGLYSGPPGDGVPLYSEVTYATAAEVANEAIQPKSLRFAEARSLQFRIGRPQADDSTLVGAPADRLRSHAAAPHLRVAVLGAGTVGGGVIDRLLRLPGEFTVVGVAARSAARRSALLARGLEVTDDPLEAVERPADVVVELMGGLDPASTAIERSLQLGRSVVTANKAVVAHRPEWTTRLRYAGAVGGATPMVEAVRRVAAETGVAKLRGVLNGTTNYVLDQLSKGACLADAIGLAQRNGYAECDPTGDLNGQDASFKLTILGREAFGARKPCPEPGLDLAMLEQTAALTKQGRRLRQVATGRADWLSVAWHALEPGDSLYELGDDANALEITDRVGRVHTVAGAGAGRYPTTEAVLADLFDLRRELGSQVSPRSLR